MKNFIFLPLLLLISQLAVNTSNAQGLKAGFPTTSTIRVHYRQTDPNDSLILVQSTGNLVTREMIGENYQTIASKREAGGWFNFTLKHKEQTSNLQYIYIMQVKAKSETFNKDSNGMYRYELLDHFLISNQDNIVIEVKPRKDFFAGRSYLHNFSFQFRGKGALKYALRYKADFLVYQTDIKNDLLTKDLTYNPDNFESKKIGKLLSLIALYRPKLNKAEYEELINHCLFSAKTEEATLLHYSIKKEFTNVSKTVKQSFLTSYNQYDPIGIYRISLPSAIKSYDFTYAELGRNRVISTVNYGPSYRDSLQNTIMVTEQGETREKVLLLSLLEDGIHLNAFDQQYLAAQQIIKSPKYLPDFVALGRKVSGQIAYNFELPDRSGKRINLSDFKGKIVFVDFWYTGCGSCLNYYKNELSKAEKKFERDSDVVFITISIDKKKDLWLRSVDSGIYTSPSIINLYTDGQGTNSNVIKYYNVFAYPQPLVISPDQKIYQYSIALRNENGITKAIENLKKQ